MGTLADKSPSEAARDMVFWRRLRLASLLTLATSFAMLAVSSAIAARRVGVANVQLEPETTASSSSSAIEDNSQDVSDWLSFGESWTVHVGVWRACAQLQSDKGTDKWVATDLFYGHSPPESDIHNEDLSKRGFLILEGLADAVNGLGAAMTLVPLAAGLAGFFIAYQLWSYVLTKRPLWWQQSSLFTNYYSGLVLCGTVFVTTLMAWAFEMVLMASAHDIAENLSGLRVESVREGGVLIMTSIALILQLVAFYIQFQLFGRRELESILAAEAPSAPAVKDDEKVERSASRRESTRPAYQGGASVEPSPIKQSNEHQIITEEHAAPEPSNNNLPREETQPKSEPSPIRSAAA